MLNIYSFASTLAPSIQVWLRNIFGRNKEIELKMLKYLIKKGDTVIDVGAHHGIYTFKLKKIVGKTGLVYCIEPQEDLYQYLLKAFRKSKNISIINVAAHNMIKFLPIYIPIHDKILATGGASLKKNSVENSITFVNAITLDSLNLQKCEFIKIDVEGHELNVLKGAVNLIKYFHPILLIEIDYNLAGKEVLETVNFLQGLDYKPYSINKKKLVLMDFNEFRLKTFNRKHNRHTLNFFFI